MIDNFVVRNYTCGRIGTMIVIRNFINVSQVVKNVQIGVGNVRNPHVGGKTGNFLSSIGDNIGVPYLFSYVTLTANSF